MLHENQLIKATAFGSPRGVHGVTHRVSVYLNARRLAKDKELMFYMNFAFFHDCCRRNDEVDPGHGSRAATHYIMKCTEYDREINCDLMAAISFHSSHNVLQFPKRVLICWDADALDLPRVNIKINSDLLYTDEAKEINDQSLHNNTSE